jgi:hypothetical protein
MTRTQPTRADRRQLARDNAEQPPYLTPVPRETWPEAPPGWRRPDELLRSRTFLCQVFKGEHVLVEARLSINRTVVGPNGHWGEGITWEELQQLKAEAGYPFADAVEIYPTELDVVNVANMRHLWVLKDRVPFAWRWKG